MSPLSRLAVTVLLASLFGCTCKKSEPVVEATPPPKPAQLPVVEKVEVVADASIENPPLEPEAAPGEEDAGAPQPVEAYLADCAYTFQAPVDSMGEISTADECVARDFEQNCAPDSCFDDAEKCKDDCGTTCKGCQTKCADSCSSCKAACAGNPDAGACERTCAEARSACRDTCMGTRGTCVDATCSAVYDTCTTEAAAHRKAVCPDCDALMNCMGNGAAPKKCLKKFPGNAPECAELCFGQ